MTITLNKLYFFGLGLFYLACAGSANALTLQLSNVKVAQPNALYYGEAVYVKLYYHSDIPIRVQTVGEKNNRLIRDHLQTNPLLIYPAGEGELITWLTYTRNTEIDGLQIIISDYKGTVLSVKKLGMTLHWNHQPITSVPRQKKRWWQHLGQPGLETPAPQSLLWVIFKQLFFLFIPAYLFFQVSYLCTWSGEWRRKAANPLLVLIPVFILTWFAILINSTWWPLPLGIVSPFALLYLLLLKRQKNVEERSV